jgi:hypothetical protein
VAAVRRAVCAVRRIDWHAAVRARRRCLDLSGEDGADRTPDPRSPALARSERRLGRRDRGRHRSDRPSVVDSAGRPLPAAGPDDDLRPLPALLPTSRDRLDRIPPCRSCPRRPDGEGVLLARIPDPVAGQVRLPEWPLSALTFRRACIECGERDADFVVSGTSR